MAILRPIGMDGDGGSANSGRGFGRMPKPNSPPDPAFNGGTIPAPAQQAQPSQGLAAQPSYNYPQTNFVPSAPSTGPWAGPVSPGTPQATTPPPQPQINFEAMGNGELKGHDSTFADQDAMYTDKLRKYIADYDRQVGAGMWGKQVKPEDLGGTLGNDFKTASAGIERNRTAGLTSVSEDFANRGLGNSGLFVKNHQDASNNYDRQKTGLGNSILNQVNDLGFRRNNFEADIQASLASARRDALSRLASSQSLM